MALKKTIIRTTIVLIILICLAFIFFNQPLSGGKMGSVAISEKTLSKDGKTLSIKTTVYASAGYVKTYKSQQEGDKLYITFCSTLGFNNPYGAKDEFDIDVTDINFLYQYDYDRAILAWERD